MANGAGMSGDDFAPLGYDSYDANGDVYAPAPYYDYQGYNSHQQDDTAPLAPTEYDPSYDPNAGWDSQSGAHPQDLPPSQPQQQQQQQQQQQYEHYPQRVHQQRPQTPMLQPAPQQQPLQQLATPQTAAARPRTAGASAANPKQTSTFRGVSCCGKDRKWQARIRDANKVRYLGRFATEIEAALVYDEAARTLKGDRAPTNFVPMDDAVKEELKRAFIATQGTIPDHLQHLVIRPKGKDQPQQQQQQQPKQQQHELPRKLVPAVAQAMPLSAMCFPDSPVAKVKGVTPPLISPSAAAKSSVHHKASQVQSRLNLSSASAIKPLHAATAFRPLAQPQL